jgi:hypothetical protein
MSIGINIVAVVPVRTVGEARGFINRMSANMTRWSVILRHLFERPGHLDLIGEDHRAERQPVRRKGDKAKVNKVSLVGVRASYKA